MQQLKCKQTKRPGNVLNWINLITIEPIIFFYMLGHSTTLLLEQSFFVYKTCRANYGYNATICNHINEKQYKKEYALIQVTVVNFQQWNGFAMRLIPIFLACFVGAWSDKHGRKLPILMGTIAKIYYSAMLSLNAFIESWPIEYIIYMVSLPSVFMGLNIATAAATYSYLSDVTRAENRTTRFCILEIVHLVSLPIGTALGTYLFSTLPNRPYNIIFMISTLSFCIAFVYACLRLEWRTSDKQTPWKDADNMLTDFFDKNHLKEMFQMLAKPRSNKKRMVLYILLLTTSLYFFFVEETEKAYLYLTTRFNWSPEQYNTYKTFQTALQVPIVLVIMPMMTEILHLSDIVVSIIGTISNCSGRLIYALANTASIFCVGAFFSGISPIVKIALHSMLSKIVSITERGKLFSLLAASENLMLLLSEISYTQLYNHTFLTQPNSIFYLTLSTQACLLIFLLFVYFFARKSLTEDKLDDVNTKNKEEF